MKYSWIVLSSVMEETNLFGTNLTGRNLFDFKGIVNIFRNFQFDDFYVANSNTMDLFSLVKIKLVTKFPANPDPFVLLTIQFSKGQFLSSKVFALGKIPNLSALSENVDHQLF